MPGDGGRRARAVRVAVVVVVVLVGLGPGAATVAAVEEPRERPGDTSPPVRVYVGETLNVSGVELTGGGTIGTDTTTFVSTTGDEVFSVNPPNADFGGVESGSYDAQSDDDSRPELTVVRPRITDLDVTNERGVNVSGRTVEAGDLEEITVAAEYNFEEADRLDVDVESPEGLDLAGNGRITTSGGSLTVDTGDTPPGTYRITVEGSDIEEGSRTVTVTVSGAETETATATATTTGTATETNTPTGTDTPTVTATETPTVTATEATPPTASPTATPVETTTEGGGPGFGVAVALLALASVAAVLGRRV